MRARFKTLPICQKLTIGLLWQLLQTDALQTLLHLAYTICLEVGHQAVTQEYRTCSLNAIQLTLYQM